jgi:hypothetical protein
MIPLDFTYRAQGKDADFKMATAKDQADIWGWWVGPGPGTLKPKDSFGVGDWNEGLMHAKQKLSRNLVL